MEYSNRLAQKPRLSLEKPSSRYAELAYVCQAMLSYKPDYRQDDVS